MHLITIKIKACATTVCSRYSIFPSNLPTAKISINKYESVIRKYDSLKSIPSCTLEPLTHSLNFNL